jgi:hypothetical protein
MYRTLTVIAILLVPMIVAGCSPESGDAEVASTTVTSSSVTTSTTSTTTAVIVEPVDVGLLMVDVLSSPAFSAEIAVSVAQTTPSGPVTSTGVGSVLGNDSALQLIADFSNLTVVAIEPTIGLVGPGFETEKASETRVIDDFVFSNEGERWMIRLREPSDGTTVGHILSEISKREWLDTGTETIGGDDLHRLEPTAPVEFDLKYFDVDPGTVTESVSSTVVYATDDGFPSIIEVDLGLEMGEAYAAVWEFDYKLSETSAASFVGPPGVSWVSIQDLSEGRFDGSGDSLIELALLTGFIPVRSDPLYLAAESDLLGGIVVDVQIVLFSDPPITFDEALAGVMRDLDLTDPQSEQSEFGGYPAATVTATHTTGQPLYIYFSLFSNNSGAAVLIQMLGSGDEPEVEPVLFDEILSTFAWQSGDEAVPGNSIGSALLQMDAETIVLTIASVDRETGCDSSVVVFTEFLGSTGDAWTEEWYVASCGVLEIYQVTFTESPGGGTDIVVSGDTIVVGADSG